MIQQNPALAQNALQDPRMITVLGVLLGIDMQGFAREEGSDELPPGVQPSSPPPPKPTSPKPAASTSTQPPPTSAEPEPEEDEEDAKARKEAEAEKKKGNEAYKKKDFATAEAAFMKAWELWPKDVTFLTNLSAAYFEQGAYDKCVEACDKAVEEGRSLRADYKLIAKVLGRKGNAYSKKGEFDAAIRSYQSSLTEHRTPDVLAKLHEAEKLQAAAAKNAYLNPELSAKAREEGNALFKAGDFAGAVKAYTEAIKRDPSDPRGYNNRANAYTKLVALPEALKDADAAIAADPKFVKAYIRKSQILVTMKEHIKAMEAAQQGETADTEKKHTAEIEGLLMKIQQEMYAQRQGETDEETLSRAMRDPEIAAIMSDPVMRQILQQAQNDPGALQEHLKNPMILSKFQKLVAAGVVKTGR